MKRDLTQLATRPYDVLVIGGGIYGAAIAREAACSGLRAALIEQEDFAHATSGNSLKILHSGFRYLQDLNFKRMRDSVKSQIEFMRLAPELVHPLGCLIPTYGYGPRGKLPMRIALAINDLIGFDRNDLLGAGHKLGSGKVLSREAYYRIVSLEREARIDGGAQWFDSLVQDTERLTMTLIHHAYEYGACIANYVKAGDLNVVNNRVVGVRATDALTGKEFEIKSRNVVNATGPWLENTLKSVFDVKEEAAFARGLNVVVKKSLFNDRAVGLEGSSSEFSKDSNKAGKKRFYFFVPWRGYTMIGTAYKLHHEDPTNVRVEREDIERFIREINAIYPTAELAFHDVSFFHAGLLPVAEKDIEDPYDVQPAKRCEVIEHDKRGGPKGLVSVRSVKYTTAPVVARKVMRKIEPSNETGGRRRNRHDRSNRTEGHANSHIPVSKEKGREGIAPDLEAYLESKYGKCAARLQRYVIEDSSAGTWISRSPALLSAEVLYVIQEEMAIRLSDVVFRRTGFGNAACPSRGDLEAVADIMATELGWNETQKADELKAVFARYHPLRIPEE